MLQRVLKSGKNNVVPPLGSLNVISEEFATFPTLSLKLYLCQRESYTGSLEWYRMFWYIGTDLSEAYIAYVYISYLNMEAGAILGCFAAGR